MTMMLVWTSVEESATLVSRPCKTRSRERAMTSAVHPQAQLVTAAEAARLLGVTRQRVLELAEADGFPAAERTPARPRAGPRRRAPPPPPIPVRSLPAPRSRRLASGALRRLSR